MFAKNLARPLIFNPVSNDAVLKYTSDSEPSLSVNLPYCNALHDITNLIKSLFLKDFEGGQFCVILYLNNEDLKLKKISLTER